MCEERIGGLVHALRVEYGLLELLAARKVRVSHDGVRPSAPPTPLNLTAFELLGQVDALTAMLASGLPITRSTTQATLEQLEQPNALRMLMLRPDAPDIERVLRQAVYRVQHTLNGDRAHVYIGVCPSCGWGVWAEERSHTRYMRCEMCHERLDVSQVVAAHLLRLRTTDWHGTISELCGLLRSCGWKISRNTMKSWVRRRQLHAVGTDGSGVSIYRLSDVIACMQRPHTHGRRVRSMVQ